MDCSVQLATGHPIMPAAQPLLSATIVRRWRVLGLSAGLRSGLGLRGSHQQLPGCTWQAIEGILGTASEGDSLRVETNIPADWPGFSMPMRVAGALCEFRVVHTLAGLPVLLPLDGTSHDLVPGLSPLRCAPLLRQISERLS